jgi:CspA family cold shock protein
VPTGKVKWYDAEKGFGFLSDDAGGDVFLHANALPDGVTTLKGGTRVEFGIVEGRRGSQALQVRVLEPTPSVAAAQRQAHRKPTEDMVVIIEDLIKLLDNTSESLRRGKYPDKGHAGKVAQVLRAVAADLEA